MATLDAAVATPVGSFLAGVGASFLLKLSSSVDDLVWLTPFLTLSTSRTRKVWCCVVYLFVCVLVAAGALGLAAAVGAGFGLAERAIEGDAESAGAWEDGEAEAPEFWNASRVLGVCASAVLFVYALVELRAWLCEDDEFQDDISLEMGSMDEGNPMECGEEAEEGVQGDGKDAVTVASPATTGAAASEAATSSGGVNDDRDDDARASSRSTRALFAVALCGTLDDLVLFAAVVAGRGIPWMAVLPGAVLAALVVLFVCWHAALYAPFANFIKSVPMWALLGAISVYLFVGALI